MSCLGCGDLTDIGAGGGPCEACAKAPAPEAARKPKPAPAEGAAEAPKPIAWRVSGAGERYFSTTDPTARGNCPDFVRSTPLYDEAALEAARREERARLCVLFAPLFEMGASVAEIAEVVKTLDEKKGRGES